MEVNVCVQGAGPVDRHADSTLELTRNNHESVSELLLNCVFCFIWDPGCIN